jgi:asparagine synthase (glutamine-hydrolysing)
VSAQFGRWNIDGAPVHQGDLTKAGEMLAPYGPDGGDAYIKDNVGILYRAFHTTKESRTESQPLVTPSGAVLTWDGRLDNRAELILELRAILTTALTDVSIVAAAYEWWGKDCFAKLIGDWALSIWNPRERSLILAKDPVGTRHLYYSFDQEQVCWSTILDPLVLLAGKTLVLQEEYVAGWLSFFPATHLTPYVGIHSVPPSTSVLIRAGKHTISKYWDFDPNKRIRYRTDGEYEEHFRTVFAESVRRRLRSDRPILAELSGGMDSSSIVCMADVVIARGQAEIPRLETISYYDDEEPNWNERPYFAKVEEKRGRTGLHIDVGSREPFEFEFGARFAATPSCCRLPTAASAQFTACIESHGNRVLLSGTGGDEVMGGVPSPKPELADLLASFRFGQLASRMVVWALVKRKPLLHLLWETVRAFLPINLVGVEKHRQPPVWIQPGFERLHRLALRGYETRLRFFGTLPSYQESLSTLDVLRRQLAGSIAPSQPRYDKCYPYLDRDLLEFIFALPPEQLVRPHQRRSLMRRALVGIVPDEILSRKRKAFISRVRLPATSMDSPGLTEAIPPISIETPSIVNPKAFVEACRRVSEGQAAPIVPLARMLTIESWMRNLRAWNLVQPVLRVGRNDPFREVVTSL